MISEIDTGTLVKQYAWISSQCFQQQQQTNHKRRYSQSFAIRSRTPTVEKKKFFNKQQAYA